MTIVKTILVSSILILVIFFSACSSSDTQAEESRTITVTLRNLEDDRDVHIYFETDQPGNQNFVARDSSIVTSILARRVGHVFNVYVDDAANVGGQALLTTNVTVTQTSWDARAAELHWTGTDLLTIGW